VWPASGSVTDGAATWTYQRTLADTSQAILWNYVDGSATPTQRQIRMQVLPTVQGGNLTITGAPGTAGITASGGVVSNGPSETGFSFNVPYNSAGNNAINYNSASNSVTNLGLALGAVQTVGNTNNAGMSSQKIQLGFSNTAAATVQNYQMVVAPTATGGTLQFNATGQDANLFVKTGLQVGSPTGGMGTVGTVKASGAGTFNGGFGVFTTTTPVTTKPTLTGAWAGNTAGKALATLLASYGLLTDSTSA
jgi:hypothetical protein